MTTTQHIIQGDAAGGDFSGNYPNPTLSNTTNVQNIIKANAAALTLTSSPSKTASFTAAANTYYPVDATSGAITVTLPTSSAGQQIAIKKTDAGTNIVTISGTINGVASSTLPLRLQNQGKVLIPDGSGGWNVYAGDLNLASTDARYLLKTGDTVAGNLSVTGKVTIGIDPAGLQDAATKNYVDNTVSLKANNNSPTFSGTPATPTPAAGDNSTQIANTAFVTAAILAAASSYDDVKEASTFSALPATGKADTIYYVDDTGLLYRWSGSAYIQVGGGSVNDATTTSKGIVQLAGDLGGTAASPTVPTKVSKAGDTMTGGLNIAGANPLTVWNSNNSYSGSILHDDYFMRVTGTRGVAFVSGDYSNITFDPSGGRGHGLSQFTTAIDLTTHGIQNVTDPVNAQDGATKNYVDTNVTNKQVYPTQASTQTTSFTAVPNTFYPINASGGNVTVTLPTSAAGQAVYIKKLDANAASGATSGIVNMSGTINGVTSATVPLRKINQAKRLNADGSGGWTVVNGDLDITSLYATAMEPGTVQLAGDLSGTAIAPTVANIARVFNVKDYGAKGDARNVNDGAMTSGSSVLSSSTAAFTSADIGKLITVAGAAAGGDNLASSITGYTSASQVTLATNASTTVSGKSITYGTNDSAAIQNCVNAALGTVYFPIGYYMLGTTIAAKTGVQFLGADRSNTLLVCNSNIATIATTSSGTTRGTYQSVTLRNLTLRGNNYHSVRLRSIKFLSVIDCYFDIINSFSIGLETLFTEYCDDVYIRGNYVTNPIGNGIQVNGVRRATIVNNVIENTGDDGIDIDQDFFTTPSVTQSDTITVTGNTVTNAGTIAGNGIRVESSTRVAIVGNVVSDCTSSTGILINSNSGANYKLALSHVLVEGNVVDNCLVNGIKVDSNSDDTAYGAISHVAIHNNVISNSGQTGGSDVRGGINLASSGISVVGNNLYNCGKTGGDGGAIVFFKTNNHYIANNYISNSAGNGINAWNGSGTVTYSGVTITNNKMVSNATDYSSDALNQTGITLIYFGSQKQVTQGLQITAGTPSNGKIWTASDTNGNGSWQSGFTNPMTTAGDIIYENSTPAAVRLAAGTTTQVLHSGTTPSWGAVNQTTDITGTTPVTNGGTGTATAFTAGSIVFSGASGVYNQNNVNLFWDNTNNRLGVNTASPSKPLTVQGAVTSNDVAQFRNNAGADKWGITMPGGTDLNFVESGIADGRLYLQPGGNIGINSTAPTSRLFINGSFSTKYTIIAANTTLDATYSTIEVPAAYGVSLPTAASITGRQYRIINTYTAAITITANGTQTIGNTSAAASTFSVPSGQSVTLVSNGSNWRVI